jgi:hypothetical protein
MRVKKSKGDEYLDRAREADEKAEATKDFAASEIWKKVAETYRKLARRAEQGY